MTGNTLTVMDNMEDVLMELNMFEKQSSSKIPQVLEDYLIYVAKTGTTFFPWNKIKPLIRLKLEAVINEFNQSSPTEDLPHVPNVGPFSFMACKDKVFQQLDCFGGIPFTVQRLCELLTAPTKHYKRTDKFMRALEKNMLVVSTVDPRLVKKQEDEDSSTPSLLMNGDHSNSPTSGSSPNKGEPRKPSGEEEARHLDSNGIHASKEAEEEEQMEVDDDLGDRERSEEIEKQREARGPCDSGEGRVPTTEDSNSCSTPTTSTSSSSSPQTTLSSSTSPGGKTKNQQQQPSSSEQDSKSASEEEDGISNSDEVEKEDKMETEEEKTGGPCDSGEDATVEANEASESASNKSSSSEVSDSTEATKIGDSTSDKSPLTNQQLQQPSSSEEATKEADHGKAEEQAIQNNQGESQEGETTSSQEKPDQGPCDSGESCGPNSSSLTTGESQSCDLKNPDSPDESSAQLANESSSNKQLNKENNPDSQASAKKDTDENCQTNSQQQQPSSSEEEN